MPPVSQGIHPQANQNGGATALKQPPLTTSFEQNVKFFRGIGQFFSDVRGEFAKVTWPTRETTLQSTWVVLIVTVFVSLFLGVVDLGLSEAIKMIIQ